MIIGKLPKTILFIVLFLNIQVATENLCDLDTASEVGWVHSFLLGKNAGL